MAIKTIKIGKCPVCNEIIDLNGIEEIDGDAIVGCGLAEGDFIDCIECINVFGDDECERVRSDSKFSITTAGRYAEA